MKSLIVYFSRAGENYVNGAMKELEVGNTQVAAGFLQEATGADLFHLEMKEPYSAGYRACVEEAKRHWKEQAHCVKVVSFLTCSSVGIVKSVMSESAKNSAGESLSSVMTAFSSNGSPKISDAYSKIPFPLSLDPIVADVPIQQR